MQTVIDILIFLAVLLLLIGFHEFGHLLTGKLAKIPIEKFSIGFGPAIFKWKIGETTYQLSVVPLGGYVKYRGEDFDDPEGFFAFPFGKKAITTAGGIIANFVLAIIIYLVIGLGWGVQSPPAVLEFNEDSPFADAGFQPGDSVIVTNGKRIKTISQFANMLSDKDTLKVTVIRDGEHLTLKLPPADSFNVEMRLTPVIGRTIAKGPADRAGIKRGARIIAVDDKPINTWNELLGAVRGADSTKELRLTWIHKGDTLKAPLTPEKIKLTGDYGIGVLVHVPTRPLTFVEAIWLPIRRTGEVTVQILTLLGKLIGGKESARNLGGVILIATLSAQSRRWGLDHLLGLLAYLSISLAIINLFPIPALDGGRILMFAVEKISGKKFGKKTWAIAVNIGFIMIIALLALTVFNDIFRLIKGG
jgi:regulator of sigma E protease